MPADIRHRLITPSSVGFVVLILLASALHLTRARWTGQAQPIAEGQPRTATPPAHGESLRAHGPDLAAEKRAESERENFLARLFKSNFGVLLSDEALKYLGMEGRGEELKQCVAQYDEEMRAIVQKSLIALPLSDSDITEGITRYRIPPNPELGKAAKMKLEARFAALCGMVKAKELVKFCPNNGNNYARDLSLEVRLEFFESRVPVADEDEEDRFQYVYVCYDAETGAYRGHGGGPMMYANEDFGLNMGAAN